MTQNRFASVAAFAFATSVGIVAPGTIIVLAQAPLPQFAETVVVTVNPPKGGGTLGDHFMTFSGPFRVPGASLVAGTYVFTFPERNSPGTIRVSSADRARVHVMIQTIGVSDNTRDARPSSVITWLPQQDGVAASISSWFPVGSSRGWQFLYAPVE